MAFVRSYCTSVYYFENRLLRFKFGREDHVTRSGEVNPPNRRDEAGNSHIGLRFAESIERKWSDESR